MPPSSPTARRFALAALPLLPAVCLAALRPLLVREAWAGLPQTKASTPPSRLHQPA